MQFQIAQPNLYEPYKLIISMHLHYIMYYMELFHLSAETRNVRTTFHIMSLKCLLKLQIHILNQNSFDLTYITHSKTGPEYIVHNLCLSIIYLVNFGTRFSFQFVSKIIN